MVNVEKYFARVDQSKLAPWFLAKCKLLVANCLAKGAEFYVLGDGGFRDPQVQADLYAIGRTTELSRKPVTNARPWASWHNYGLAMDFCRDANVEKVGLQPSWNESDYLILQEECHKLGLTSGLDFTSFRESPHSQVPFKAGSTGDFKKLYQEKGVEAVWELALNNLKTSIEFKKHYT